MFCTTVQFDRI